MSSDRPSFLLATSNGTGMGHLSRQLAVALAGSPDIESTLFSLSVGLPTATREGISGEYCPGPDRGWMPEVVWPLYLRDRLIALAREIDADALVVSEGRRGVAEETNLHRKLHGKPPLEIFIVPYLLAMDGSPIKATRIANEEIDTEGKIRFFPVCDLFRSWKRWAFSTPHRHRI